MYIITRSTIPQYKTLEVVKPPRGHQILPVGEVWPLLDGLKANREARRDWLMQLPTFTPKRGWL